MPRSDIFHPDFQYGRSAYFDVSIRSTTQPAYISSSTYCAGVAAAAGEAVSYLYIQHHIYIVYVFSKNFNCTL